jgi:hypothetical protein
LRTRSGSRFSVKVNIKSFMRAEPLSRRNRQCIACGLLAVAAVAAAASVEEEEAAAALRWVNSRWRLERLLRSQLRPALLRTRRGEQLTSDQVVLIFARQAVVPVTERALAEPEQAGIFKRRVGTDRVIPIRGAEAQDRSSETVDRQARQPTQAAVVLQETVVQRQA